MVIVEPNDRERKPQDSESLSTREQAYKDFFSDLAEAYADANPRWYQVKAQPRAGWGSVQE